MFRSPARGVRTGAGPGELGPGGGRLPADGPLRAPAGAQGRVVGVSGAMRIDPSARTPPVSGAAAALRAAVPAPTGRTGRRSGVPLRPAPSGPVGFARGAAFSQQGWCGTHVGGGRRCRCGFRAPARCRSEAPTGRTGRRSKPLELPPPGRALQGLPLNAPPQGFDLLGIPPLLLGMLPPFCPGLRGQRPQGRHQLCRSSSVNQLPHSLDRANSLW